MNRMFWGVVFLAVTAGTWAQSTWRGQAEVWPAISAPVDGYVAASNEFPRNSLLTVENYRVHKTIQVRVVSTLPAGSSALVVLNAKAAQALDIKPGEVPLVGIKLDIGGIDRPDNPDPDVNPLAQKPVAVAPVVPAPVAAPVPAAAPAPSAPVAAAPAPTAAPVTPEAAAPASSLEVAKGATALDPDLLPVPALAPPTPSVPPTPLAVADEPEPVPVTPGKQVFLSTHNPEPVTTETPADVAPEPAPEAAPDATPAATPVEPAPEPAPATAEAPETAPAAPETPAPATAETPEPTPAPAPEAAPAVAPAAVATNAVPRPVTAPAAAWVDTPSKLSGPVLGQVALLASLEKGKPYVQVGAWASEADLLAALDSVKTYVPLSIYRAEGQKNPWRVVAAAPNSQLGVLLASYRNQGFRTANVIKG